MTLTEPKTIQLGEGVLIDVRPELDYVQIRVKTRDGEHSEKIKKVDLWAAVFAMMDGKMQDDLMPVRQTQMMTFDRLFHVRAKRDLKKGDVLKFRAKIDVPLTVVESLKGMLPEGTPTGPTIHMGGGGLA